MSFNAYINLTSAYLPNSPISNDQMESILGQAGPEPSRARRIILKKNGIKTRYYAIDRETGLPTHNNIELTAGAIRALFDSSQRDINSIEFLSCGTASPDQIRPSHAVMVHGLLKTPPCEVASLEGICCSGIQALKAAYLSVISGEAKVAVSTGSEIASRAFRGYFFKKEIEEKTNQLVRSPELAFEKDFLRWMLSDGAGAILVEPKPNEDKISLKIEWIDITSFANEAEVCMYHGATKDEKGNLNCYLDISQEKWLTDSVFALKQDVKLLNENIIKFGSKSLQLVRKRRQFDPGEVTYFLPHYSSDFFRIPLYEKLTETGCHIPLEKWFTNIEKVGNVGSASAYLMLNELFQSGQLKQGNKILMCIPESGRFTYAWVLLTVV